MSGLFPSSPDNICSRACARLDLALIKYHLWHFKPTVPQARHYALITGGSTGLGREMAFQLAAKGYSVVLAARAQSALDKTQSELRELHLAVDVLTLVTDLSSNAGIQQVIDFVQGNMLIVDILINNASVTFNISLVDSSTQIIDQALAFLRLRDGQARPVSCCPRTQSTSALRRSCSA